jgi:hypothetical protein
MLRGVSVWSVECLHCVLSIEDGVLGIACCVLSVEC